MSVSAASATEVGFALFATPIGTCGIAWGTAGITGVQLPESRVADTRARIRARAGGGAEAKPPPSVQRAIDDMLALLRGDAADLGDITLDFDGVTPFHRLVYEATRTIPPGETLSYGDLAAELGKPGAARAVGQALGRNPFAIVVPCHRVLAAGGKVGGFSATGGVNTKLRILELEGTSFARASRAGPFAFDPEVAIEHLRGVDTALARVIERVGPFDLELQHTSTVFSALTEAIVYQQLSGKAAATIHGRVVALFPRATDGPTPRQVLRASDEQLRGAGLSRAKVLAVRDLAQRTVEGTLPTLEVLQRMNDDEVVEHLSAVRGIGRWTAEMFLIFRLGRPDVLPLDDYGMRKGLALALKRRELPDRAAVARRGARWQPYRTVATWYLWRAVELASSS